MKFVVSSTALLNVLQTSSKVVSNKNTLPILDNFLFDLKEGVLKITASDLETTLIGSLKVDNMEEEGLIAVPVKLMLDSLKEFSEQPLTIEANESTWEIQVSWKTGKLTIPGTSGLSYPNLPELNPESRRELDADADMLLTGINKTIFATASTSTSNRRALRSWRPTRTSSSNTYRRSKPKSPPRSSCRKNRPTCCAVCWVKKTKVSAWNSTTKT